jgi:sulfotransferase famil protein
MRQAPVHFLHVRKTGGTAIAEALRPFADAYGIVLHEHTTRLSDVPRDDRVVFFVRHPLSRFVSGFFSRLRCGLPRHYYRWNEAEVKAFRHFQKANDLAEALSATNPETLTRAHEAMTGISHIKNTYRDWFSGTQELDDRLDSIVLIGLQETLSTDFVHLKGLLQLPRTVSLPADDTLAHRTPLGFDRQLSPLAVENLSRWFAEDIRFYEYCVQLRSARGL